MSQEIKPETKTISVGEVCTIDVAKSKEIFDISNYFKNDFLNSGGSNVKIYNGNLEDNNKTDSICSLSENSLNAYPNCAYIYNNPYLVNKIIDDKNYCVIADNIYPLQNNNLNSEYKIGDTSNEIFKSNIYNKYNLNQLCEERWHDWFCIPDYHHGNKYYNELPTDLISTKSVGTCYVPCPINYIPMTNIPTANKCIIKDEFEGGLFSGKFNYTPLALICLFGLNENIFKDPYIGYPRYMDYTSNNILKNKNLKFNNNNNNIDIINYIKDPSNNILKDIWGVIKEDINYNCEQIHYIIPDIDDKFIENNIIEPNEDIRKYSKKDLNENIYFAYMIAKKIKKYLNNENENVLNYNHEDYKKWKRDLMSLNPKLNREKIKINIKIIKKCANICFNGETDYSKNYILYNLKDYNDIEPIIFDDINFDPEDEIIIINEFKIKEKDDLNYLKDFIEFFNLIIKFFDYYSIILGSILAIILLYIIYITYYKNIFQIINYIRNIIYYCILSFIQFIYIYILDKRHTDSTDYNIKKGIKDSYIDIYTNLLNIYIKPSNDNENKKKYIDNVQKERKAEAAKIAEATGIV